jgi:pantetheine-phosphate adenylyltransferase
MYFRTLQNGRMAERLGKALQKLLHRFESGSDLTKLKLHESGAFFILTLFLKTFNLPLMKRAIFPGTFDPFTRGHFDVVAKGLMIFDEIIISIGVNTKKNHLFDIEKRVEALQKLYSNESKIKVMSYEGLTVSFCKKVNAKFILRGLRNASDFDYEQAIAHANREMEPDVETIFVLANSSYSTISSTIVREIMISGGDYKRFIPEGLKMSL